MGEQFQVTRGGQCNSEFEIAQAMKLVNHHHGHVVEGAVGVALASLLKKPQPYAGKNVVVVLCGRNISREKFNFALSMLNTE